MKTFSEIYTVIHEAGKKFDAIHPESWKLPKEERTRIFEARRAYLEIIAKELEIVAREAS
jgi:hypothetical protein